MFKENYVIFDGKCVYKTHGFNDFFNFLLKTILDYSPIHMVKIILFGILLIKFTLLWVGKWVK